MRKQIVIYVRFSDVKQRTESLQAQEMKCRQGLSHAGIDHTQALVLKDSAQRGDREDRDRYAHLVAMIRAGEVAVLCVDQQSRFSRGPNVRAMVKDLVFAGGRFIAVGDGIDTIRQGWEDLVGLKEIHNQMEVRDTGWRVRRSQEQRVEDKNGSAGDYPYGYSSEHVDPAAALNYHGRGPKPARKVVINEPAADVVREIFTRFTAEQSLASIVRWLNEVQHIIPRIGSGDWHHQHVRRILVNEKYIGQWVYGRTTTVRNSEGKKKQVGPQPHQKVITSARPDLRIINQQLWEAAQARIQKLKGQYGMKPGGKKRGPAEYFKLMFPKTLLSGLIYCPGCGSRLIVGGSNGVKRLGCPKHRAGTCPMAARVPYAKTEEAVLGVVQAALSVFPDWVQRATDEMRQAIRAIANTVPKDLEAAQARLPEVQQKINHIVNAIEDGVDIPDVRARLAEHHAEKEALTQKITELERLRSTEVEMPDDGWLRKQFQKLAEVLKRDPAAVRIVRSLIGRIEAEEVTSPGKKRGYVRLRFRLDGWAAAAQLVSDRLPAGLLASVKPAAGAAGASDEFIVDLGQPTNMDRWAPQIVEWRKQKVPWKDIVQRTGLQLANAYLAYRRHLNAEGRDA